MKFLHTADWHIGKTLRGRSRLNEYSQALTEIMEIATREKIDCLLVAGDIFDSQAPPAEAERLVYQFFAELAGRRIPAVVIGGNHDHPGRLEALKPLLDRMSIHVRHQVAAPDSGGVIEFEAAGERARIAVFPWVPEHRMLDAKLIMGVQADRSLAYAEEVSGVVEALCSGFTAETVNILVGHAYVVGAEAAGSERAVHLAKPYALTPQRFPATASYIALGHLHRPQEVSAPSPTVYSGSLLQLDFGEQGQEKSVVLIDARAGRKARFETVRLTSGRGLKHVTGTPQELRKRAGELNDTGAFLHVTVKLDKPQAGIADEVRRLLPDAVDVRMELPETLGAGQPEPSLASLTPQEIFARFCRDRDGREPEPDFLQAFTKLYEEVN